VLLEDKMSKQFKQYDHDVNEDGSVNIRNLEIFEPGFHKGANYDEEWWGKALDNFNSQKGGGFLPVAIIGHNKDGEEKPAKGFLDNLKVEEDMVSVDVVKVPEETFKNFKDREFPNRSVEVNHKSNELKAVAFLGGTAPYFKFPIMEFGEDKENEVIEYEFAEEPDLKAAIETEKKMRVIRDIWWKVQEFIDNVMWNKDKSEEEKKTEVKSLLDQGVEILGEEAKNFKSTNKQGENTMAETKVFTEEELNNAKDTAFDERFKEKFGKPYDEYVKENEAEVSKAKEARIKSFADTLKKRNIAPAIIDDMLVPFMEVVPSGKETTVKFKDGDKEAELDIFAAFEKMFEEIFKLDEKGALLVDFSEKAETNGGESVEEKFGDDEVAKIDAKAREIAAEKAGASEGEKFNDEYQKAVFALSDKKEAK
jgi:hypothetical protein